MCLKALVICHEHIHQTLKFLCEEAFMTEHVKRRTITKVEGENEPGLAALEVYISTPEVSLRCRKLHLKPYAETLEAFCSSSCRSLEKHHRANATTDHTYTSQTCTDTCRWISVNTGEQTTLIRPWTSENWVTNAVETVLFYYYLYTVRKCIHILKYLQILVCFSKVVFLNIPI